MENTPEKIRESEYESIIRLIYAVPQLRKYFLYTDLFPEEISHYDLFEKIQEIIDKILSCKVHGYLGTEKQDLEIKPIMKEILIKSKGIDVYDIIFNFFSQQKQKRIACYFKTKDSMPAFEKDKDHHSGLKYALYKIENPSFLNLEKDVQQIKMTYEKEENYYCELKLICAIITINANQSDYAEKRANDQWEIFSSLKEAEGVKMNKKELEERYQSAMKIVICFAVNYTYDPEKNLRP